jgi:hypothetical protein
VVFIRQRVSDWLSGRTRSARDCRLFGSGDLLVVLHGGRYEARDLSSGDLSAPILKS